MIFFICDFCPSNTVLLLEANSESKIQNRFEHVKHDIGPDILSSPVLDSARTDSPAERSRDVRIYKRREHEFHEMVHFAIAHFNNPSDFFLLCNIINPAKVIKPFTIKSSNPNL